MPSVATSGSAALQMLPLIVPGQRLEISLERLGQPMSLYVPLSKGTHHRSDCTSFFDKEHREQSNSVDDRRAGPAA